MAQIRVEAAQNFLVPNATVIVVSLIFLFILYFFYKFVVPPLTRAMDEREEMNRKQVQERDQAVATLAEAEQRYERNLAEARATATTAKDEARADAQRIRDEMKAETDREVAAVHERGAAELDTQRAAALSELHGQVGDLSTELASKVLGRSVTVDQASVQRLLADVGTPGGQG